MILAKFIGISSLNMAIIYMVLLSIGPAAYWMFIFNFLYDVIDVDEVESGVRKDGIIMSYYSFLLKLGGALAAYIQGILLGRSGFDVEATVQTQGVLSVIESMFTILPGIFMLLAGLVMILSPLSKTYMNKLHQSKIDVK